MCLEPPGQCKRCNLRPSRGGEDAVGPTPTRYRVFRDEEGDGRSEILRDGREKGRNRTRKGEKRGRMGEGPEVSSSTSTATNNIKSG